MRTEKSRYESPDGPDEAPRPWICAFDCPMFPASVRTVSRDTGCGVTNVTCVPPRKSIPRFSPLNAIAPSEMRTTAAEIANHVLRRPM